MVGRGVMRGVERWMRVQFVCIAIRGEAERLQLTAKCCTTLQHTATKQVSALELYCFTVAMEVEAESYNVFMELPCPIVTSYFTFRQSSEILSVSAVLQCVAVCCSVRALRHLVSLHQHTAAHCNTLPPSATHSITLQHNATHDNTLQHTNCLSLCFSILHRAEILSNVWSSHCNTLQHSATRCNTLQQTATHCNTLQHTRCLSVRFALLQSAEILSIYSSTHCNTLQHIDTRCNTLQHTATHQVPVSVLCNRAARRDT